MAAYRYHAGVAASGKTVNCSRIQWIDEARRPDQPEPIYGYMNWFSTPTGTLAPSAPPPHLPMFGNGTNMVYVDQEHDVVARGSPNRPEAIVAVS